MGSQTLPKLPVLDFSSENLKLGTNSWIAASDEVRFALEEYGCFIAVYDKVSLELHRAVFDVLEELFDLPTETKVQNTSDRPYFGYVGQHPLIPLFESLGMENAGTLQSTQSFTNLMWPSGNDHFCETVYSYTKLVLELEQMVKRMVFESYGVEKYYDSHIGSSTYLFRAMKYRCPNIKETNIGVDKHTDKSFISILQQNQVNGLEVETKDGHWIGFEPCRPSSFVVMAGDAFLAWSNNRVHSPNHRVIMKYLGNDQARYSLGLFSFNKGIIHIPEELADDEHPLQFKPFDHFGLLHFHAEVVHQNECVAKAYCGI